MRSLIAEDQAISRRVFESPLIKWGYEVVVTRDGRRRPERRFSVTMLLRSVILDVLMP